MAGDSARAMRVRDGKADDGCRAALEASSAATRTMHPPRRCSPPSRRRVARLPRRALARPPAGPHRPCPRRPQRRLRHRHQVLVRTRRRQGWLAAPGRQTPQPAGDRRRCCRDGRGRAGARPRRVRRQPGHLLRARRARLRLVRRRDGLLDRQRRHLPDLATARAQRGRGGRHRAGALAQAGRGAGTAALADSGRGGSAGRDHADAAQLIASRPAHPRLPRTRAWPSAWAC